MANKRIRTDAPDTVVGVERRVAKIQREPEDARPAAFSDLVLDTLVGIAEAGKDGYRVPDDPIEVAREVLCYGAEVYADSGGAESWITWKDSDPDA